ncbi:zinc finger protein 596-like isoform X2 [Eurosta solidaginis]|uniref:zinc finger protein 596-like isoform X2 n=1 Tax=Eurosta solidaginis TaxID=178769 RepID=UPI0035306847
MKNKFAEMEVTNVQRFDSLCRTCMLQLLETSPFDTNSKPKQEWQSIFDVIEKRGVLRIVELLAIAIPQIEVHLNDELPKKICCECVQQLRSFYLFQQMCTQSDRQLREWNAERNHKTITGDKISVPASLLETSEEVKVVESVKPLLDGLQTLAADPLQNVVHIKNARSDVNELVKNEACDDEPTVYSDDGTLSSKGKTMEEQVNSTARKFICHICNKSLSKPSLLRNHVKLHHASFQQKEQLQYCSFKCDLCNRYFHKAESLYEHRLVHDEKVNKNLYCKACKLCGKIYSSQRALTRHYREKHTENKAKKTIKHTCKLCNKSYTSASGLRRHGVTHSVRERPHLCPECGKSFTTAGNMKQHRLRHRDDKPFECPHCPLRFRCYSDIANHKASHSKNKTHICGICGSAFHFLNQLRKHEKNHTGERPYKCDYCDKRFVRSDQQRVHMRTHTGEKPYKCKYCECAYAQGNDLIKHLRTHLGDNVYRCELCPLAFRLASEQRLHLTAHKNEDPETRERNIKALRVEEAKLVVQDCKNCKC